MSENVSPRAIADWLHEVKTFAPLVADTLDRMTNEQLNLRDLVVRAFEWRVARILKEKDSDADYVAGALLDAEIALANAVDSLMNNTLHSKPKPKP